MNRWIFPLVIAVVVVGLVGIFVAGNKGKSTTTTQSSVVRHWADNLPGLQTGPAPWKVNNDSTNLKARLGAVGLPALGAEGTALHIHQHLDIYVEGKTVAIPPETGIAADFISPIHVHDTSGILHVESPTVQDFYLGQFFAIWGVDVSKDHIGSYKVDDSHTLKVYVNGKQFSDDPRDIKLTAHEEIAIVYGTADQQPSTIPSSFSFPKGL